MKKIIATVTAAAMLAGAGTYALAQGAGPGPAAAQERRGMSQDDYNRFVDAHIAAIKAGLKLNADQDKLWPAVENAIRANATERFSRLEQRRTMRDQDRSMDFMQRLEQRSTMMADNAQRMSTLTTALRPLWTTFSEDQKRIAPRLMRPVMAPGGMGRDEREGRHGRDGDHGRMGGMMRHDRGMMGQGGMGMGPAPAPKQP